MIKLLKKVVIVGLSLFLVYTYIGSMFIYYDNNMFPSIKDGDLCVIKKYDKKTHLEDVVYYQGTLYRVIARENQEVNITDKGILTVDGQQPQSITNSYTFKAENSDVTFPYTVPSGEIFLLNDFRENQEDSRIFKSVKESEITGIVFFVIRRRGF